MVLLCVLLQADRRTKTLSPYGKYTNRAEMCLPLIEKSCITAIIKVPLESNLSAWQRNKCDHSRMSDLTSGSRLLNILWHCFFLNVAALLHCLLGSAQICESIMLLPVADISTGYCCCILQTSPSSPVAYVKSVPAVKRPPPPPPLSAPHEDKQRRSGHRKKLNCS